MFSYFVTVLIILYYVYSWMNYAVFLFIKQRFEKLCRAILASMEVENEPKVSLHV